MVSRRFTQMEPMIGRRSSPTWRRVLRCIILALLMNNELPGDYLHLGQGKIRPGITMIFWDKCYDLESDGDSTPCTTLLLCKYYLGGG